MRILLVGASGAYNLEAFYMAALRRKGVDFLFLDQYEGVTRRMATRLAFTRLPIRGLLSKFTVNRKLPAVAKAFSPDAILVFKGELVDRKVLRDLSSSYRLALFYPDAYSFPSLLKELDMFSVVFTSANRVDFYLKRGARRVVTVPFACDPSFHRKMNVEKRYPSSFIGTFYPNRYMTLRKVKGLTIFGSVWPPGMARPPLFGEDYVRGINETVVNVNVHHPSGLEADAPNMRVFEVTGCSGFLLTEEMPSLRSYFPQGVETYSSNKELIEKVEQYKDDPELAEEMGMKAGERCRSEHTYDRRAEVLLRELS